MDNLQQHAKSNNQRAGQFLSNAIQDYLYSVDRRADNSDVWDLLFYMSDKDLGNIITRYDALLNARRVMV